MTRSVASLVPIAAIAAATLSVIAGCGETKPAPSTTTAAPAAAPAPARGAAAAAGATAGAADAGAAKGEEYSENDFVENDRNRDPFRQFLNKERTTKGPVGSQIVGILGDYSVDELKLSAIVMGGDGPMAMLVDPRKKGWTVKKGDFVGRLETVHTGGQNGADYFLQWRVDRIREGDIVFIREDRANPSIAPATRVVTLHKDSDKDQLRQN